MTTPEGQPSSKATEETGAQRLRIDRSALVTKPKRSWTRWAVGGAAVVLAVALWSWWQSAPTVQAATVVMTLPSQQFVDLTASGYVVAQRRASVASKATGRLIELNVREGSLVKAGQVLARLDASDVQAAMASARAGVLQAQAQLGQAQIEQANAQAELKRSQGLVAQGFISPQALDAVRTRNQITASGVNAARSAVMAAQAQMQAQQVNQDFTEIRAPFDGVVLVKNANVGDIITPFSSAAGSQGAVVTMADMSTLEVEADVSESQLGKVRVGQPVEIVLDALPDERFRGVVGGVVPTVDRAKATVTTKIRFEQIDPRILPEMSAKVNFLSRAVTPEEQQAVMAVNTQVFSGNVQAGSTVSVWKLVSPGQTNQVAEPAAKASSARYELQSVSVRVGPRMGDVQAITPLSANSLKAGDQLLLSPQANWQSGQAVTLAQP